MTKNNIDVTGRCGSFEAYWSIVIYCTKCCFVIPNIWKSQKIMCTCKIALMHKDSLYIFFNINRYVSGNDLFVAGTHVYNHYRDCKDTNAFLCGDKINDIITLNYDKVSTCVLRS